MLSNVSVEAGKLGKDLRSVQNMYAVFKDKLKKQKDTKFINSYALITDRVLTEEGFLDEHALIIKGIIIEDVCHIHQIPEDMPRITFPGKIIAPGFIDLQVNGYGGVMLNEEITVNTLDHMYRGCLCTGTTTFLPTLISCTKEEIEQGITAIKQLIQHHPLASPGIHLEGPFLSKEKVGIHNAAYVTPYNSDIFDCMIAAKDVITVITLAPEIFPEGQHIAKLCSSGISVALGHTAASSEQVNQASQQGCDLITHVFNAMEPIGGRTGEALMYAFVHPKKFYASIIADGFHVHATSFQGAKAIFKESLFLVTDGTAASAAAESLTAFNFTGKRIHVQDGRCSYVVPQSQKENLGGSSLTMFAAVKNTMGPLGCVPLEEALRMASLYPARVLGADHFIGSLKKNYLANAVIFDASCQHLCATLAHGEVYIATYPHIENPRWNRMLVYANHDAVARQAAIYVADKINIFSPSKEKPYFVLGLPTGNTVKLFYSHLVALYNNDYVNFRHIVIFNLDEYIGLSKDHACSYACFMQQHLYQYIDIDPSQCYIPDGMSENLRKECQFYEEKIKKVGGIDLLIGGIGINAHIAFNEPDTPRDSLTHVVNLHTSTLQANKACCNFDDSMPPAQAITMGLGTILNAKEIMIFATGASKKKAIHDAIYGEITESVPASLLRTHQNTRFLCDQICAPWMDNGDKH